MKKKKTMHTTILFFISGWRSSRLARLFNYFFICWILTKQDRGHQCPMMVPAFILWIWGVYSSRQSLSQLPLYWLPLKLSPFIDEHFVHSSLFLAVYCLLTVGALRDAINEGLLNINVIWSWSALIWWHRVCFNKRFDWKLAIQNERTICCELNGCKRLQRDGGICQPVVLSSSLSEVFLFVSSSLIFVVLSTILLWFQATFYILGSTIRHIALVHMNAKSLFCLFANQRTAELPLVADFDYVVKWHNLHETRPNSNYPNSELKSIWKYVFKRLLDEQSKSPLDTMLKCPILQQKYLHLGSKIGFVLNI